jgi:ATP-dependent DNA helicase DinG
LRWFDLPALALGGQGAVTVSGDGEVESFPLAEAGRRLARQPMLVVHATALERRFGQRAAAALDLLELYAFVRPARFCLPTARGLARALGLRLRPGPEGEAMALHEAAEALLLSLRRAPEPGLVPLAQRMAGAGWGWGPAVLDALGAVPGRPKGLGDLAIWEQLPEWEEEAPLPPPSQLGITALETRRRLAELVAGAPRGGMIAAEARPEQADYASAVTLGFQPRDSTEGPSVVLAEAGTGVGKTLGYLAPATLWAERNQAPVWVSTYTRNLQTQIDGELDRLYPDPTQKAAKVVLRKGRENYLCLLNFEEAARAATGQGIGVTGLGLVARWAMASKDGALVGGDFPGWLADLVGRAQSIGLADRRGECIYAACPHFKRCVIERTVRRSRRADIVVANHALVMMQAALGVLEEVNAPTRFVFDEGHHVFEAADGAFSAHLSGFAAADLRRWILGTEGGASRARGIRRRLEDLIAEDDAALEDLQALLVAAAVLPGDGWAQRLAGDNPRQAIERFLALVRVQVLARTGATDSSYDLEADRHPLIEGLAEAAVAAEKALAALAGPMGRLATYFESRLEAEADTLDSATRNRLDGLARSIRRRLATSIEAWRAMLREIEGAAPEGMADWFSISRLEGRDMDIGLHRHWIDPTIPFAAAVLRPAQGVVMTSATLTDSGPGDGEGWLAAELRSGARHLAVPSLRARVPSPFDYAAQTRCLVVTDVRRDDLDQVAAAYRELFLAAGGGALGLFTAINRLRAVHGKILRPLDEAGLPLLAQHLDGLDTTTLVDIFRAEEDACLLGTDAVRDGVDVPGRALRLIVFDRVPWPRPDILHRARRQAFGGPAWDDRITRLRLRQAFGRLIRRDGDQGVFVLLDSRMPSRLATAFPQGVELRRVGLADAIAETRTFLAGPESV